MAHERAQAFAEALKAFESGGDLDTFVEQFAEDCEVGNVATDRRFQGREGAKAFWRSYHALLAEVRSEFRAIIEAQDRAALEWETEGVSSTGQHFRYEGTSILEFEGDKVKRFTAYFDPQKLGLELTGGTGRVPAGRGTDAEVSRQPAVEGP